MQKSNAESWNYDFYKCKELYLINNYFLYFSFLRLIFFAKRMDLELKETFQNYKNVVVLYIFFQRTIRWLCEHFFKEKLIMIICEYEGGEIGMLDDEQMKKNLSLS